MSKARLLGQQRQKERFRTQRFRTGRCQRCGAKLPPSYVMLNGWFTCRSCGSFQKYTK